MADARSSPTNSRSSLACEMKIPRPTTTTLPRPTPRTGRNISLPLTRHRHVPAFDPTAPIPHPARPIASLVSGAWDLGSLLRFELATTEGLRLTTPFAAAISADALLDAAPAIDSLLHSGCDELHIDFHTLGPIDTPRSTQLAALIQALQDRNIRVHGTFTLGHDHDDIHTFERLVDWIEARRLAHVELRLWTPDPGSATARELALADRIRHRDLRRWDGAHVVVTPAQMSAQTLYRGWVWARRQLNSPASIWRRRPTRRAAVPGYLLHMIAAALAPEQARARARARLLPALGGDASQRRDVTATVPG